ncbi:helix-turn-helix domain-containing protein [Streptomyces sp. PSKA54]|uniref:Helix-turn-helix domain-containing protein n=1 Tax=Streptomyces himalayensis subsp. aureolus TaxID=2758039 RepID=A0A7W2HH34_9ACTN|nr:helix-turn-helix domain-containing protein [Streptomyces himalayensis]MBA4863593.1 helix-turn-helix domain-containing protein [Streptomyces himalayensis subsp. aureolus]
MARPAPAAAKALKIIDLLVTHRGEQFTISDLARRTGSSLGSAHAVLAVLEESGYLTRHPTRRTYGLGPALVSAGIAALEQHPAIRVSAERITELSAELDADVVVSAATPAEIVFVAVGETSSRYGPGFREGERLPLVPPLGLVFMAWAHPREVEAWLGRAPFTLDRERVELALAAVRDRGYALGLASAIKRTLGDAAESFADPERAEAADRNDLAESISLDDNYDLPTVEPDQEYDLGMASAPVFDADRRVLVAITASGFSPGLTGREVIDIAERVKACATLVTKQTRGRLPG